MNLKYGVNTAARTGVIVRPFAEAASAALLSVACWHAWAHEFEEDEFQCKRIM